MLSFWSQNDTQNDIQIGPGALPGYVHAPGSPRPRKKEILASPGGPNRARKIRKNGKHYKNAVFFRYKKKQHISVCIFCDFWTLPGGPGLQKSSKIIVGSFKIDGPTVCQKNLKLVENTTKMMPKRESRNSRNSRRMQKDSIGSRSKFHWFFMRSRSWGKTPDTTGRWC